MAKDSMGSAVVIAAVMLGIAILGSSYFVSQALDRGTARLGQVLAALQLGTGNAGERAAAVRPDEPPSRYQVAVGDAPTRGPADAPVTIVEWSDFQCPFCGRVRSTLAQVERTYGDRVRIAFKHMPLPMHSEAPAAHAAAEAAHRQGHFWDMHDRIFANQRELTPEKYAAYAAEIGLDVGRFERDTQSADVQQRIAADIEAAGSLGVSGTPAFFINGRFVSGAQPFESFKRIIDEELAKRS
jgi:protein-disulfide isomerase